jgi:hypothetical protein
MHVIIREIAGWALVLLGVLLFGEAMLQVLSKRIFSAGPFVFAAFVIFRGGLHLIKVATAARACAQGSALPNREQKVVRALRPQTIRPGAPRANAVPGPNSGPTRK